MPPNKNDLEILNLMFQVSLINGVLLQVFTADREQSGTKVGGVSKYIQSRPYNISR